MQYEKLAIPDVVLLTPQVFGDERGFFMETFRQEWLDGRYQPQPIRKVEIPKPEGGQRRLGIPTVMDRMIQQAVLQILQLFFDPTFSNDSYGFRPKRSAHQAIQRAQEHPGRV